MRAALRTALGGAPRTTSGQRGMPRFLLEIVGRDGVVLSRRETVLQLVSFARGDLVRLDPAAPAFRVADVEHVFEKADAAAHTVRVVVEPA